MVRWGDSEGGGALYAVELGGAVGVKVFPLSPLSPWRVSPNLGGPWEERLSP